jgi:DNA-binding NarL/FixJ family response regulator
MPKILIADDHLIFAQGLASLLCGEGMEVAAVVNNGQEVLNWLSKNEVDIVISDLQMPLMGGVALTLKLREQFPTVKVLMLSMTEDLALIREAIQAGILGFAFKSIDKDELLKAIRLVSTGEHYFSTELLRQLTQQPVVSQKHELSDEFSALSEREIDVLKLVAAEHSTNEIADLLFVSVNTVETHRKNLFKKLNIKNSLGLMKFALRNGLVCV